MKKKKVLVIIAHPDDETIWMGGTLIRNKNKWDTTIISLCRSEDSNRAPKFKRVCEEYKVKSFMSNLEDEKLFKVNIEDIVKIIKQFAKKEYDYVFTHGENGEYGHIRHIETNKAVRKMLEDKSLVSKKIFFFSYMKIQASGTDTGFDSISNPTSNKFIKLKKLEFLNKKMVIEKIYGFQKGSFEERNCKDLESFRLI